MPSVAHELVGWKLGNFLTPVKFFSVISLAFQTGINVPILKKFTIYFHFRWMNPTYFTENVQLLVWHLFVCLLSFSLNKSLPLPNSIQKPALPYTVSVLGVFPAQEFLGKKLRFPQNTFIYACFLLTPLWTNTFFLFHCLYLTRILVWRILSASL